ncbi:MAG: prephenate dehydratase [Trueperaceae bacterium]|nr:prephenate dehydratase [Trueperaceae bacterium]MCC6310163.1 prephenate dehydratase [Trueperaceae bacterium]MCO5174646.1 prephenate dehydratase [Trueperaceae bacterium]MCW5819281.1 prephenate dehydratase [Trueperaceae bacterium]
MSAKGSVRIAYQGVPGAFSEEASLGFAPGGTAVGFPSFEEAFAAAADGTCDYACLPVENSLAGSINQTYDLLTDSALNVVGERIVRVHHNLLAKPGVKLSDIKRVYSHPQALAQCAGFIRRHKFEAVTDFDTAGAAMLLAQNGGEGKAAIASVRAAQEYGLDVLAEKIEDLPFNFTRFFVLAYGEGRGPKSDGGGAVRFKSSMVLATRHRPGDLVTCLEVFPKHDINMTKLESRPRRDKPWSYLFYIDIDGHIEEPHVAAAMTDLMRRAAFVKFLGSYPAAEPIEVS